jgi:glycosyltransferase involved in cell wall biosynthesis
MKPRLLFLIDEDRDFCSHRFDLARAAQDDGFEVLVATHVQHHGKQIEDEGFKLFPTQLRRGLQSPLHDLSSLIELVRLYRREQPDIVYHVALKQVLFGAIAARIVQVPAMVSAVTGLGYMFCTEARRTRLLRAVIKPALRGALAHPRSMVIFQNDEDCEDFVRAGVVSRSGAVIIRGVGVNVSQFCPSPEPDGVPVVVLASRMLRDKGVGEFVEAARLLKGKGIKARCVLVGMVDNENPSSFTETDLRRWESEGAVEWWGHRDDMADVFASCHVVVLPSYSEGFPKVLLEAAACARPLIATNVRGCREIVRDGENGLLVPSKDPQALAHAVLRLVQDKALRRKMGERGRDIVMNEFRAGQIAAQTIAVCHGLLEMISDFSPLIL